MKKLILLLLFLMFISTVSARQGSIKLIAVSEQDGKLVGSVADLILEIQPGSGRVFIASFPLTKLDTQISTRFANEVACKLSNTDCSQYDFFYTIHSSAPIVGGPSAGGAITTLTFAELLNLKINEDVTMTGTINAGGLIGPVGGVPEKIEAAKAAGLKKVLVPQGDIFSTFENQTLNISQLSAKNNIKVVEVSDVYESVYQLTGIDYDHKVGSLVVNPNYNDLMKEVATQLCNRSEKLYQEFLSMPRFAMNLSFFEEEKSLQNKTNNGLRLIADGKYYSGASFCYTANVGLRAQMLWAQNLTEDQIDILASQVRTELMTLDKNIDDRSYSNLPQLETYTIVKERIVDADNYLDNVYDTLNSTKLAVANLANAIERLYSARSWMTLYEMPMSGSITLDQDMVHNLCMNKILEAEERYAYVSLFMADVLLDTRREIDLARTDADAGRYELCLYKATKAKAEADVVLLAIGVPETSLPHVLHRMQNITRKALVRETDKGVFPIIGYSYYEYSQTLSGENDLTALLYNEYAMELSNLDMYFKQDYNALPTPSRVDVRRIHWEDVILFSWGIVCGILIAMIMYRKR